MACYFAHQLTKLRKLKPLSGYVSVCMEPHTVEAGKGSYRVHKRLGWAIQRHPVERKERGGKGRKGRKQKKGEGRGGRKEEKKGREGGDRRATLKHSPGSYTFMFYIFLLTWKCLFQGDENTTAQLSSQALQVHCYWSTQGGRVTNSQ